MTNNKQQTAVDLMYQRAISVLPMGSIDERRRLKETYEQAKEMEKEQSEKYADYVLELFEKDTNPMSFNLWNETYGGN